MAIREVVCGYQVSRRESLFGRKMPIQVNTSISGLHYFPLCLFYCTDEDAISGDYRLLSVPGIMMLILGISTLR
jgi:hypothetical protein